MAGRVHRRMSSMTQPELEEELSRSADNAADREDIGDLRGAYKQHKFAGEFASRLGRNKQAYKHYNRAVVQLDLIFPKATDDRDMQVLLLDMSYNAVWACNHAMKMFQNYMDRPGANAERWRNKGLSMARKASSSIKQLQKMGVPVDKVQEVFEKSIDDKLELIKDERLRDELSQIKERHFHPKPRRRRKKKGQTSG